MIVVPEVTPVPEMDEPAISVPDVTEVTVSTVPEIDPVTVAVTVEGNNFSVVLVLFTAMPSTPE